jgi:hypothetical protein
MSHDEYISSSCKECQICNLQISGAVLGRNVSLFIAYPEVFRSFPQETIFK